MQTHGSPHSSKKSMDDIVEEHLKPIKLAFKLAANPECKNCFGRGYTGQIKYTLILVPCPKCIDLEKMTLQNDNKQSL